MPSVTIPTNRVQSPFFNRRTLHLFTLCGFAFTEPLLTALTRQTVYLHDEQFGAIEIAVLLTTLTLVLPLCCFIVDRCVSHASRRLGGRGRQTVFVALFGVVLLSLLRPSLTSIWLMNSGYAGMLAIGLTISGASLATILYERVQWFQNWLTIAAVGIMIFPGMFLWQLQAIQKAEQLSAGQIVAKNPVPVVFVVFDEFSGTTLMNDQMEIDAKRFPQFARLAKLSTWYRNATTVHPRTDVAVPSILSGRFPSLERSPLATEYPGNLFRVIESTKAFDMTVFEPLSRICPVSVGHIALPDRTSFQKSVEVIGTLATVFPRLIFTSDIPIWLPEIPERWFGLRAPIRQSNTDSLELTEGLFHYSGGQNRIQQLQHFLKCLKSTTRPRFMFLHAVFPHYPWSVFPSGDQYQVESTASRAPAAGTGELGEDWREDQAIVLKNQYRYRLQVGYVDQFIGQLLDQLEESGLMDRCLVVVTADHGVSFRAGHSRRLPDTDNVADILSVPLFIKLPGQTLGRTDDRNVESVDLLPTVAEVLGIELQVPVDGISVSQTDRRPRKTFYFNGTMTVIEPNLPQREAAVRRQFAHFGDRDLDQPPCKVASHPDWLGRSIDSFAVNAQTVPVILTNSLSPRSHDDDLTSTTLVPHFITGVLHQNDLSEFPADLVVAVDGIIRDSGKTFRQNESRNQVFEFLLPQSLELTSSRRVELYLIDQSPKDLQLRPLKTVETALGVKH